LEKESINFINNNKNVLKELLKKYFEYDINCFGAWYDNKCFYNKNIDLKKIDKKVLWNMNKIIKNTLV